MAGLASTRDRQHGVGARTALVARRYHVGAPGDGRRTYGTGHRGYAEMIR